MTRRRSRFRPRFRKSFNIIPGIWRFTVSLKSLSTNFNLGIFSHSVSTRGTSSTIDMPGTSGIFARRETRRSRRKRSSEEQEEHGDVVRTIGWTFIVILLVAAELVWGLGRIWVPRAISESCDVSGHPTRIMLMMSSIHLGGVFVLWLIGMRGFWALLATLAGIWLIHWHMYGAYIAPLIHCK